MPYEFLRLQIETGEEMEAPPTKILLIEIPLFSYIAEKACKITCFEHSNVPSSLGTLEISARIPLTNKELDHFSCLPNDIVMSAQILLNLYNGQKDHE